MQKMNFYLQHTQACIKKIMSMTLKMIANITFTLYDAFRINPVKLGLLVLILQ